MLTALLGAAIFGEQLKPLWWVGAGCLVVGNVIIGRKKEGEVEQVVEGAATEDILLEGESELQEEDEDDKQDVPLLGDLR